MTKICGAVRNNNDACGKLIRQMNQAMQHEPWHSLDDYSEAQFEAGHISLGKINPEKQPIWNRDRTKCIVMAGKIFNYKKDKEKLSRKGYIFQYQNNDPEYILYAYEEYGSKSFKSLNGVFAFAIWDKKSKQLVIVNDRYGFRPLFYARHNEGISFASEVKALLKDDQIPRNINWKAWGDFYVFGWIFGNDTYYKNIYALPPASVLIYKNGKLSLKRYWDYRKVKVDTKHSEDYFVNKGAELVESAVKRQIEGLEDATCFLTGGLDSRGIAATIKKLKGDDLQINTYIGCTFNTEQLKSINAETITQQLDFHHRCILETIVSKEIATALGFKHTTVFWTNQEEKSFLDKWAYVTDGMTDAHLWAMNLVSHLPQDIHVNFDGAVAGVFLKGHFISPNELKYPSWIYRFSLFFRLYQREQLLYIKKHFHHKLARKMIFQSRVGFINELLKIPFCKKPRTLLYFGSRTRRSIALAIYSVIATKTECFCPYLDNDLMEFALSIPPKMIYHKKIYRKILEKIDPQIMKIPSSSNDDIISDPAYIEKISTAKATFLKELEAASYFDEKSKKTNNPEVCPIETSEPHFIKWYNSFNV